MYKVDIGNLVFKVYKGDITAVKVDVIVNEFNTDLDLSMGKFYRLFCTLFDIVMFVWIQK